jgi:hypothetical protein
MATADLTLSKTGRRAVVTSAQTGATDYIERGLNARRKSHEIAWRQLIDHPLIDWWKDPEQLNDDGMVAPSRERIEQAIDIAMGFCDSGDAAPVRVVPDGYGGIVFEFRAGLNAASLRISDSGDVEFVVFESDALVSRRKVL